MQINHFIGGQTKVDHRFHKRFAKNAKTAS